jgi:hypothetical protein
MSEDYAAFDTDFNLEDEYKPTPFAPIGSYKGSITDLSFAQENMQLNIQITLNDNGEDKVMSDGETRVDGQMVWHRAWFPKAGDDTEMTKNGAMTKRQFKINQLTKLFKNLKIEATSAEDIQNQINNKEWVGKDLVITLGVETWDGEQRNNVKSVVAVN